jgi:hypothetical protein
MTDNEDAIERTVGSKFWANHSLGDDLHVTLQTFQQGLTVGLIATDRSAFETCSIYEELAAVIRAGLKNLNRTISGVSA